MSKVITPPVIRVFLSSTFADMEKERSYFNEFVAPKISRACAERGVSFFTVDLRWGITQEDQVNGKVLPICLSEIDKCRPYFIGILGNRYGSILETVPDHIAQTIPWLEGKEGYSITELEMLYAVLDHDKNTDGINSAFYMRSDRLSQELYGELKSENPEVVARLDKLKKTVCEDGEVLCSDYDSIEQFGELVLRDLMNWLNENFPESEDVGKVRREWYNGEILRNYTDNAEMDEFMNVYVRDSRKSLLIYGSGARGKTTFLTAWQPQGDKILINCGADDKFSYWPSIANEIVRSLNEIDGSCGHPDAKKKSFNPIKLASILRGGKDKKEGADGKSDDFFASDNEREQFRISFLNWLKTCSLKSKVTIIINDLNLLDDEAGKLLSWLPSSTNQNINIVCTTNDEEMVNNAEMLGWNVKEMPLFARENAKRLITECLHTYGKNLTDEQLGRVMKSVAVNYPGQLRFVVSFLIIHGRFNQLDSIIDEIAGFGEIGDIYRYVYEFLTAGYSENEKAAARTVMGLVRCSDVSLSERECYNLTNKISTVTAIEWANIFGVLEQFEVVKGDYWNIRNEEMQNFIDGLLTREHIEKIHSVLGDYFFGKIEESAGNINSVQMIRTSTAFSKAALLHYQKAQAWKKLITALGNDSIIRCLTKLDWYRYRSSWVQLFLNTDFDIQDKILNLIPRYRIGGKESKDISFKLAGLIMDIGFKDRLEYLSTIMGTNHIYSTIGERGGANSEEFVAIYPVIVNFRKQGSYRLLIDYLTEQLEKSERFTAEDICELLYFKTDAQDHLAMRAQALESANHYYMAALNAGVVYHIHSALTMRGNVLFRNADYDEAMKVQRRVAQIALKEGDLLRYLGAQNVIAMCLYHSQHSDESVEIFDTLHKFWLKLGNESEAASVMLNKSNALSARGDKRGAFECSKNCYDQNKDKPELEPICLKLLGNMGIYAMDIGDYDVAEKYMMETLERSSKCGQESTMLNTYNALISLYDKLDKHFRIVEVRKNQMELLWQRKEYGALVESLKKALEIYLQYKYFKQAKELERYWKNLFETIDGGKEYFEKSISGGSVDVVDADKLEQQIIMAKGEGDVRKQAQLSVELAAEYGKTSPNKSINCLLEASRLFASGNFEAEKLDCIEKAFTVYFENYGKVDATLYTAIIDYADSKDVERIACIWDLLYKKQIDVADETDKDCVEEIRNTVRELFSYVDCYDGFVAQCLASVAKLFVRYCMTEEFVELTKCLSEMNRSVLVGAVTQVIQKNHDKDLAELMHSYLGTYATETLEYYEGGILFLKSFDTLAAAGTAGNIALIFRRRKDKEKTIYYHNLSAKLYKELKYNRDYFIEIKNVATAYNEFGEVEKTIETLRTALKESGEVGEYEIRAAIAGNIASVLITRNDPADKDEIKACNAIEEEYYRSVGNERDLAISLYNQVVYLVKQSDLEGCKPKLTEFGEIVRRNGFKDFMTALTRVERIVFGSQTVSTQVSKECKEKIEQAITKLPKYKLHQIAEDENGIFRFVVVPEDLSMGEEVIYILSDLKKSCHVSVHALFRTASVPKEMPKTVQEYVDWWNSMSIYHLNFDEKSYVFSAAEIVSAPNWEEFESRLIEFLTLWVTDKLCYLSLMLGIVELPDCKGMKLSAFNSDE
ncbi:MAG: DUF4062 domain-containing protein [Clostridia bacterium]|nr:DUF4062 domain-containing protein [Clostridia bacterium]